jgi:IS30 family transposase
MGRGRRGALPLTEKREEFARLIARGLSNAAACRVVGVHPRTGKRWRLGRTIISSDGRRLHYPPVISARKREISARYLSEDERLRIGDLRRAGAGIRVIAAELGRSPSTVSRELRRNQSGGQYRPFAAQRMAEDRRARTRSGKLAADPVLRQFVAERLEKRWSPEQICQALRREFPGDRRRHLACETIYQAVYRPALGGLPRSLPGALRTGRRRRPHRRPSERRGNGVPDMTMIGQRPAAAADRCEPGHWEGDLILGAGGRSAIGTLVDRASRFTILVHVPGSRHTAEVVRDALVASLAALPPELRRSLTWDQGKEMSQHAQISQTLEMPVFFCDPHAPWQRPTNENTYWAAAAVLPQGHRLARSHSRPAAGSPPRSTTGRARLSPGTLRPADSAPGSARPAMSGSIPDARG